MKKFLVLLLLPVFLTGLLLSPAEAANANRPGQIKYHNFVSYLDWKADSTLVASSDTLFFVLDSVNSVPFNTAAIGKMKSTIETEFARIPDSVGFVLKTFGDAADASSYEFNVQYSVNGKTGPWYTLGTPDTVVVAGATAQVNYPLARRLIPDAMIRATVKTTTATDITRVAELRAVPIFR
jgi:hypothetical protein